MRHGGCRAPPACASDQALCREVVGHAREVQRPEPTRQAEISYAVFCLKKKKTYSA
eukprot:NODE_28706_length_468_cov_10.976540.p3 GENE.NODE_28706_length_468_cov_10.976540~~NODE_28706_length_468_cov_10.976540.p3  ORF type:complete len:56 (+),score=1.89 NODE_28706_length_468_cov_10.976540:176-343(+)